MGWAHAAVALYRKSQELEQVERRWAMKSFKEIENSFNANFEALTIRTVTENTRWDKLTIDDVQYVVSWGVDVDFSAGVVQVDIKVGGIDPTSRLISGRSDEHFTKIDTMVIVGYRRLNGWAKGKEPFPETVDELFKRELP
jgi:hypothetical protein